MTASSTSRGPSSCTCPRTRCTAARSDLLLLWVDPSRLAAELRYERPEPGAPEFPHLYGPLNLDAVVAVTPLEPWEPGGFSLPPVPPEAK